MQITDEFLASVKDWCGVSDSDSDGIISSLIQMGDDYLKGAIAIDYDDTDERALTLIKVIVNDFYTNRGMHDSTKLSSKTRSLVQSLIFQLQVEAIPNGDE